MSEPTQNAGSNAQAHGAGRELTEEQREQIAELSNSDLPDNVYLEWLDNYGDFDDFDEAYCGYFVRDTDFAQDMADNLGNVPDLGAQWPLGYIDWEWAARDLMMDYFEIDGHYFRQM